MKFSSPANIALASIALSSPSLLSSPVFANAAPTMDNPSLSPNPGTGYFGNARHRFSGNADDDLASDVEDSRPTPLSS
ncbi:hypothetical protein BN14_09176 [Rhizoctonia solani AG-1 IB]|uniref:Uncharacterized protein n=1 Tax=Thanatephorus cucumeris (strain AG1-IB / isolate 7/3/14) TaxID=1108050 RepID=M5CFW2_THACB|nr:hypothetical protein BN14_09176 [Rhizoctonia solani AG-1 IB]